MCTELVDSKYILINILYIIQHFFTSQKPNWLINEKHVMPKYITKHYIMSSIKALIKNKKKARLIIKNVSLTIWFKNWINTRWSVNLYVYIWWFQLAPASMPQLSTSLNWFRTQLSVTCSPQESLLLSSFLSRKDISKV